MTRILIDQDISPRDRLRSRLDDGWELSVGIPSDPDELEAAIAGYDVLLVTSRVLLTASVLDGAADLRLVGKLGTGIDSVDLEAAGRNGITVTHTPGHNALSVAEHALCLVLATTRRLTAARNLVAEGKWRDEYDLGTCLSGSTLGIVGFGNVGKRVGTLTAGFDVDVLVSDPYVPGIDAELARGVMTSLDELLRESDVVVVAAERTAETEGLLGRREFELMGPDSVLVNVARGPIVDEDALVEALESRTIAGAGLDVFATEPLPPTSPLLELDNVVLTPHIAAMTTEARHGNIDQLAANVSRLLAGEPVQERYLATAPAPTE